jgi:hypothetical protein
MNRISVLSRQKKGMYMYMHFFPQKGILEGKGALYRIFFILRALYPNFLYICILCLGVTLEKNRFTKQ